MKMALKDHMTKKLITVSLDAPASEARRLMSNFWIRHLPVMDENDEYIVGMLSDRDLLAASSTETPVSKMMSSPVKTFDINTPIKAVVAAMLEEKISAFLITKDDDVVGIVTSEDMLVLLNEILGKDEASRWSILELFTSPAVQRTAYSVSQAGI